MPEKERFTKIPNKVWEWLPEIGYKGLAVFAHVCYRVNPRRKDPWCFEGLESMSDRLDMDRHILQRVLGTLTKNGLLEKRRSKHAPTKYRPTSPLPKYEPEQSSTGEKPPVQDVVSTVDKSPIEKSSTGGKPPTSTGGKPPTSTGGKPPTNKTKSNKTPKGGDNRTTKIPKNGRDFVDYCKMLQEKKYGTKYSPNYAKDGAQFKRILRDIPADELKRRADCFYNGWWETHWQSKGGKERATIAKFIRNVNEVPLETQADPYRDAN